MPSQSHLAAVSVKELRKSFRGTEVLRGISFELEPATLNAIIGPSGSGKSTLLHLIAGLEQADSGSIELFGEHLVGKSEEDRCSLRLQTIGFVFQFFHLLPALSARANAELPGVLLGQLSRRELSSKVEGLFERFGLKDKLDSLPSELSGGEMQRVSVIRALCNSPKLLLADEPTGNLDSKTGESVIELLRSVVDSEGVTAAIVTHDRSIAAISDRVLEIRDGILGV